MISPVHGAAASAQESAGVSGRSQLGAGARLAVLAAAGTLLTGTTGAVGGQALLAVTDSQQRVEQMRTLVQATLSLDELNESLRADVVHTALPGTGPARRDDVTADLAELRDVAVEVGATRLTGVDPQRLRSLAEDESAFAAQAAQLLARPDGADLRPFEGTAEDLAVRLDALHDDLESRVARSQAHARRVEHRALWSFLVAVGLNALLLGLGAWWIRRSLLASLHRVGRVARAVAAGDFTARNSDQDTGEVGDLAAVVDQMAGTLERVFEQQADDTRRHQFSGQVDRALQRIDTEDELTGIVSAAMAVIDEGLPMELLIADSSEAHVGMVSASATAGPARCAVTSPWSCPAVRQGQVLVQPSGRDLDACPRLRERQDGELAAICVPLSFMGRALGVLHAATEADQLPGPRTREWMSILGERTSARLGGLRAFARAEIQATTDTLTGLFNRRAFDEQVRRLLGRPYGLLIADLDHFKQLNDVHGHGVGDRALQLFAEVLRSSLRRVDVIARYGGEEFVVVMPDLDAGGAFSTAERIRTALHAATTRADVPAFTVSIGVSHSEQTSTLSGQIALADAALMQAKREGRDRCLVGPPELAAAVRAAADHETAGLPEQRSPAPDPAA